VRYRRDLPAWATAPASLSLYFTLISVIFSGQSRFHFALMPFIALYAGWTLARLAGAATATEREALAKSVFAPPTDAPAEYGPGGLPCKNAR